MIHFAVLNTDENPEDVLQELYENCVIDTENEVVNIDGIRYCYYTINVENMPLSSISIYELELL